MSKKQRKEIKKLKESLHQEVRNSWENYLSSAHNEASSRAHEAASKSYRRDFMTLAGYLIESDLKEIDGTPPTGGTGASHGGNATDAHVSDPLPETEEEP